MSPVGILPEDQPDARKEAISSAQPNFALETGRRLWLNLYSRTFGTVGRLPKWPTGADCKSAGYAFDGSNPSPTTTLFLKKKSVVLTSIFNCFVSVPVFEFVRFCAFAVFCVPFY